ncbi:MAG TPA: hypothetical protein VFY42_03475, partial [Gemmatimonadales bacterium]|nr:hypothetical protein [Gemmatimonadales bacterium]
ASGILPDLIVRGVPRSDAERALLGALGEDQSMFRAVLSDYAAQVKRTGAPRSESFRITREMRDQVFERLQQNGLELSHGIFDTASGYVDEQLGYEITRAVFGAVAEARRRALSDRQMQTAVRLLRSGTTQDQVLIVAQAERARMASR